MSQSILEAQAAFDLAACKLEEARANETRGSRAVNLVADRLGEVYQSFGQEMDRSALMVLANGILVTAENDVDMALEILDEIRLP